MLWTCRIGRVRTFTWNVASADDAGKIFAAIDSYVGAGNPSDSGSTTHRG